MCHGNWRIRIRTTLETKRRSDVVQDPLRVVIGRIAVARQLFALDPIADAEVKSGADWQMHNCETRWSLLVFVEDHHCSVLAVRGELGYFAY